MKRKTTRALPIIFTVLFSAVFVHFGYDQSTLADDFFCQGQSGMLGVALDPAFGENRHIYVFMASNMGKAGWRSDSCVARASSFCRWMRRA
jgi:hypothetical protein